MQLSPVRNHLLMLLAAFATMSVMTFPKKQDDLYNIKAKECMVIFLATSCNAPHQIVSFKPSQNITSDYFGDNQINVLGDIQTISNILPSNKLNLVASKSPQC